MARGLLLRSIVLAVIIVGPALGQTLPPPSRNIFPAPNDLYKRHTGLSGKPCLALRGYAKPEALNAHIFEHWIAATNSCGMHIKVRVCYHDSDSCIVMDVPPWDRKESVLGILPAADSFRFDAREQF